MATLIFFLAIWLVCKGVKWLFRPRKRIEYKPPEKSENKVVINLASLDALQKQRQQIEKTIAYIQETITTAETPEKTIQYMDRLSGLYGKLATVENKINKLMN